MILFGGHILMEKTNFFSNINSNDTLSYKLINEEYLNNEDLNTTNIIGCTIQKSIFINVSFMSADFDGCILIDCEFVHGNWSRTDSCSLTVSNTIFIDVDFTLSTMRNCDFRKCTFSGCKFDHIALSNGRFENCQFTDIHLYHSSTYLNYYANCSFKTCDIHGNFYYNILEDNEYVDTNFNYKLFSYNYFSSSENKPFELLYSEDLQKEELQTYLQQNKLLINLVILELNQTKEVELSVVQFILAIAGILKAGLLVREEQLQFIYKIIKKFLKNGDLSAITVVESLSYLEKLLYSFELEQNIAYEKCRETLNLIKNELYQAYQIMGSNIEYICEEKGFDEQKIIKIVYEKEPQIPICSILNEIKDALRIDTPDAVRIKTEKGSFYEWIICYDSMIQCLSLFIAVLGLGFNLVGENRKKKTATEPTLNGDGSVNEPTPEQMLSILNKTLSKQKINPEFSKTIQIVVKNDVVVTKKFRGYSRSNIYSIDISNKNN